MTLDYGDSAFYSRVIRLPLPSRNKLPQRLVDLRLIAFTIWTMRFEPVDHIGIQAQGELFSDGPIKQSAFCAAPVALFGDVLGIDLVIRQSFERCQFDFLRSGQWLGNSLLHMFSFHGRWPCGR